MSSRAGTRHRWALLLALGLLSIPVACSDDEDRAVFGEDAAAPPPRDDASSPDASAPVDRGPFDPADEEVQCDASTCVTQLVAGGNHFCAQMIDGKVRCWGSNEKGQLGITPGDPGLEGSDAGSLGDAGDAGGLTTDGRKPSVGGLPTAVQLSAGDDTTCARTDEGAIFCWGGNVHGELGRASPRFDHAPHATPQRVELSREITRVDVGHGSVCATTTERTALCWGDNTSAQLARGNPTGPGEAPAPAHLSLSVVRTSAGVDTAFALDESGTLSTWGAVAGDRGTIAGRVASLAVTPLAHPVDRIQSVSSFSVSGITEHSGPPRADAPPPNQHACAVTMGDIYCWGKSQHGAFGAGRPDYVFRSPTRAVLLAQAHAQQVSAGGENTCTRLMSGAVLCTGANDFGQLGTGDQGPFSLRFSAVTSLSDHAVSVAVASRTVCALLRDGSVQCWGGNDHGELGLGTTDEDPHPTAATVLF